MADIDPERKCILVTGAASGIGRATALLFAEKGWYVGLYDVDDRGLESIAREIGPSGCCYRPMDVSSAASVKESIGHFSRNTGGRMDVLFNNAGILRMGAFEDIGLEEQLRVIDVNLKGMMNCIHAGLGLLKGTKDSRVINMSSASALYGTAYLAAYSASKAAVSSLTESLNLELERHGIFVGDVMARYVRTPLLERDIQAPSIGKLGIHLEPEDVARTVWKAAHARKLHTDTKGMRPLLLLLKLPAFVQKAILRFLLLPGKK